MEFNELLKAISESVSVKNVELSIDTSEDTNTLFATIKFV